MSRTLSFVRLDFITIKPYLTLKNLFLFAALTFMMTFSTGNSSMALGIFITSGSLYISFPFAVGEQNGIDTLYSTLPLSRKNVVLGRYIFAICVNILSAIMGYMLTFVVSVTLHKAFNSIEVIATLTVIVLIFIFIESIQLPLYFRLGYAKAKLLTYLPFLCIPVVVIISNTFFKETDFLTAITGIFEWIAANVALTAGICIIVWASILCLSYYVSLNFYEKRDF